MNSTESVAFYNCYFNSDFFVMIVKFPSKATYVIHLAACILSVMITLTTVTLNLLTVLTFWWTPRLRNNILLYLVMILSMVDAATGIFCYPSLTARLIYEMMGIPNCWIKYLQTNLFKLSSILSLSLVSAISIERYFGVIHPLLHRTQVTKKKLLLLLVFIWSICTFSFVATLFVIKHLKFIVATTCLLLILLTMYAYTRIGFAVIESKKRRERILNANVSQKETSSKNAKNVETRKLIFWGNLKCQNLAFLLLLATYAVTCQHFFMRLQMRMYQWLLHLP